MALVRWENPLRELATMEVDRLNHMFSNLYGEGLSRAWMPPVDIYETAQHEVVIKAELPDVKREDISVTFENNVLTLKGERRFENDVPREQLPAVGAVLRQLQPLVHDAGDSRRARRSARPTRTAC